MKDCQQGEQWALGFGEWAMGRIAWQRRPQLVEDLGTFPEVDGVLAGAAHDVPQHGKFWSRVEAYGCSAPPTSWLQGLGVTLQTLQALSTL